MASEQKKQKILIVDDSEMNRAILADILGGEYEILEAEDGIEGVAYIQKYGVEICLVLLDMVMPRMDGFGVLDMMNRHRWIEDIPVVMISAEVGSSFVERAYELGVSDFIGRPFDALVVHRRVVNTILLYAKQKKLIGLVTEQIYEKEQQSALMIDILSHIVEFRNGESGLHVRHVHTLTELLLRRLVQKTDRYGLSHADISIISTASALHDIGKIGIDEKILNKPGKLTDEEFAVMKTHSSIGADMLNGLTFYQDEPLLKTAYEICRWHHERYDGRGYPDGLKGDDIPIAAQIVSVADVYDALTSVRVYKKAFSHETAIEMICGGKCGTFNPIVLECLTDIADTVREEMGGTSERTPHQQMNNLANEMMRHEELTVSSRTLQLLEREREKYSFFAAMSQEIQFEYNTDPAMLTLSPWGAERLGASELVMDPREDRRMHEVLGKDTWDEIVNRLRATDPEKPVVEYDCKLQIGAELRWHRIVARAMWSADEPRTYQGAIGKAIDIHDSRSRLDALERAASHDALTGLLNHASAKKLIAERLDGPKDKNYALVIFDLDHFKDANDTYGHMFGDEVLAHMAGKLHQSVRGSDIAARVGGDEFLIFIAFEDDATPIINRIFHALIGRYEDFTISVSMGVARTDTVGTDYEMLFHAADQALYSVKRSGRGTFRFYDPSMKQMLSVISPIDSGRDTGMR